MLLFAIKAYWARVRLEEEACFRHESPAKSMRERTRAPEREVKRGRGRALAIAFLYSLIIISGKKNGGWRLSCTKAKHLILVLA
jgi:hypothetical protein